MISAWVQKLIAATRPSQQVEPEANEIFKVLCGKCPKCGKTLGDHFYQLFAVIATDGRKEKLSDFIAMPETIIGKPSPATRHSIH
jgi:hypothetical protein